MVWGKCEVRWKLVYAGLGLEFFEMTKLSSLVGRGLQRVRGLSHTNTFSPMGSVFGICRVSAEVIIEYLTSRTERNLQDNLVCAPNLCTEKNSKCYMIRHKCKEISFHGFFFFSICFCFLMWRRNRRQGFLLTLEVPDAPKSLRIRILKDCFKRPRLLWLWKDICKILSQGTVRTLNL